MKTIFLSFSCLFFANIQAVEYESQFENDQIRIAKIKIEPKEEIGLHRDAYPQVLIGLKGGTITRLEANGQVTEVEFPTGIAVFRKADPENELHKSVNRSSEPIELFSIQLKNISPEMLNKKEGSHNISVNIKINCPKSEEFQQFIKSLPVAGNYSSNFTEWKSSFITNMNQLIHLVESEKIFNSWWSVNTDSKGELTSGEDGAKISGP